ncbi:MAG: hypothetical protein ACOCXH_08070 [Cyclobacteriaceae bacterium]
MQVITPQNIPPWSDYGGKYSWVEKLLHQQLISPQFHYQRGLPAFDDFIDRYKSTENIKMGILRKGYYLQIDAGQSQISCLFSREELQDVKMEAFKAKIDTQEKMAAYLTLTVGREKFRCFVSASNYKKIVNFFDQKYFSTSFHLIIDPDPPLEHIKLVDIISGFGKQNN